MTWNYRIFRHDNGEVEIIEAIHSDGAEQRNPDSWCQAFTLRAESEAALSETFGWVRHAFNKPILTKLDFDANPLAPCCDEHKTPDPDTSKP